MTQPFREMINENKHQSGRRASGLGLAASWILPWFIAGTAHADRALDTYARLFNPYAGALVESDSNLFASRTPVLDPQGVPRLSDTVSTYRAGFDFNYLFDRQYLYATVEGREVRYGGFTDLNHSEYLVNTGLVWKLTSRFDGIIDYHRERKIIAFADGDLTTLQIQTDQIVKGTFNVAVTPEWRLETQASLHTLDYPIAQSPDFRLQEGLTGFGIKYVGVANLAYGIEGTHIDGHYLGVFNAADYKQNTAQFAVKYILGQVTNLNAAVGYTDRKIEGTSALVPGGVGTAAPVSGGTGTFGYSRQLTGKTTVYLQLQRAINSYYNAGSSELDTGGTGGVSWQATPKIELRLSYQRVHSKFEGETLADQLTLGRVDNASYSSFELKYQPLHWLSIRPFVKRQVRTSTVEQFTYNNTEIGIEVVAQRDQATR